MAQTCSLPLPSLTKSWPPETCTGVLKPFVPLPDCPPEPSPQHQVRPALSRPHVNGGSEGKNKLEETHLWVLGLLSRSG